VLGVSPAEPAGQQRANGADGADMGEDFLGGMMGGQVHSIGFAHQAPFMATGQRGEVRHAFRNLSGIGMLLAGLLSCLDILVINASSTSGCNSASSASAMSLS
jgi:hypothetical protein